MANVMCRDSQKSKVMLYFTNMEKPHPEVHKNTATNNFGIVWSLLIIGKQITRKYELAWFMIWKNKNALEGYLKIFR